ncbi:hypothetical protein TM1040_2257 [Ruegeria sp. TM1040]|nr:hypothetical protein TM1040_2257 [Ruegeria sp. TM1040]
MTDGGECIMALAGLLLGMIAGLTCAAIGFFALDLSFWICLLLYSFVGALSTLSITVLTHLLRSRTPYWQSPPSQETATS